jgi:hypothetical protein
MDADSKSPEAEELRKLAASLREMGDKIENERTVKAAHVLCASKGLLRMQQKVRGWYEPLA